MYVIRGIALFLALCAVVFAQTGVKITARDSSALIAPKNAVRRYCEMDAQGFRLAGDTVKRMQAITAGKALENDWHGFDVISDFQIGAARMNARGVLVTVNYNVLGRFDLGVGYAPNPRIETVEIQTVAEGDEWKLEDSEDLLTPRITRLRALKWLREHAAAEKDPYWKRSLEQAIAALQQQ